MKTINLGKSDLKVPAIAVGCMRMDALEFEEAESFVHTAMERGAHFFDHADIYAGGRSEELFGEILAKNPGMREKMIIQSKASIVPGVMYDGSKEHILEAVDGSLKRLQTEYLDVLLLHRPDALIEPEEVAEAFDLLEQSGKVRHFGVSNHTPYQMELLKKYVRQDLLANQLQLSVTCANMIRQGLEMNMETEGAVSRDGSVLDYCRLHDVTIQAWSPFQAGFFTGPFIGNEKYPELNGILDELAEQHQVTSTTIATAWILRHPAKMQVVAGTMKEKRLDEICDGTSIALTREEWYRLYLAGGHILP